MPKLLLCCTCSFDPVVVQCLSSTIYAASPLYSRQNDLLFSSSSSVLTLLICMMAMLLPVIPLPTCIVLPLLYSVHTFWFLIFMMFLGCTSGLFSWVVSCWLLRLLIKGSLLLTIVRTGHSVPLIRGIFSAFGFCNRVLWEKVISPQPNSKPGGPN